MTASDSVVGNCRQWLMAEPTDQKHVEPFSDWRHAQLPSISQDKTPEEQYPLYIEHCIQKLQSGAANALAITSQPYSQALAARLNDLTLPIHLRVLFERIELRLNDKFLGILEIVGGCEILHLKNCCVQRLHLIPPHGSSYFLGCNIRLINCRIEKILMRERMVRTFEAEGGAINEIKSPLPGDTGAFRGHVAIKNVQLSCEKDRAQDYRNLKHHLTAMHNYDMAGYFHAAEMRALRQEQKGLDKFLNWIYGAASNYGASTALPLKWFAVCFVVNVGLLWMTGTEYSHEQGLFGWHADLAHRGGGHDWVVPSRSRCLKFSIHSESSDRVVSCYPQALGLPH